MPSQRPYVPRAHPFDEEAHFSAIHVAGDRKPTFGRFKLERTTGTLAYAPCLFVDDTATGQAWPIHAVVSLWPE